MKSKICFVLLFLFIVNSSNAQQIKFDKYNLELVNTNYELLTIDGSRVLKLERDLIASPFDEKNIESSVDGPTFAKIIDMEMTNGVIEVKVLSKIMEKSPFAAARGFIGIGFRVDKQNHFDCIYLRPDNGRSEDQLRRNHTIQYFSYPGYNFNRLRREANGVYETYADIGLNEWINVRIEIQDKKVRLFLNNQKTPSFIVNEMFGETKSGNISLWVEVGTVGYFKDLKITKWD
ncbi:MAG: hypothetical protein ACO263_03570 [Cyclobacteriaceae bacterium]